MFVPSGAESYISCCCFCVPFAWNVSSVIWTILFDSVSAVFWKTNRWIDDEQRKRRTNRFTSWLNKWSQRRQRSGDPAGHEASNTAACQEKHALLHKQSVVAKVWKDTTRLFWLGMQGYAAIVKKMKFFTNLCFWGNHSFLFIYLFLFKGDLKRLPPPPTSLLLLIASLHHVLWNGTQLLRDSRVLFAGAVDDSTQKKLTSHTRLGKMGNPVPYSIRLTEFCPANAKTQRPAQAVPHRGGGNQGYLERE